MQLFRNLEDFPQDFLRPLVIALGFFDGLHLGHQKILRRVIESARAEKTVSAVFTFQNHPQSILNPSAAPPALITSLEQKLILLEESGIDLCFAVPFTVDFSKMSAEFFVESILLKRLYAKKICLGYNAHFGQGRQGNPMFMREMSSKFGFYFEEIGPVEVRNEVVSSSRIRRLVQAGDLALAAECLGKPYAIRGHVVKGDGRGAQIGFPTANLETDSVLMPPQGVYPVHVRDMRKKCLYEGVLNFGRRPTFKGVDAKPLLEAHLLNYKGDALYGTELEILFYPRIREERVFSGISEIQLQIAKDVEAARRYFCHPQ